MGKFKTKKLLLVLLLVLGAASLFVLARFAYVYANVPNEINFQGKLTDINGVNVADGTYDFQVRIYNDATADTGGALIYTQSLSGVQVTNGIFNLKFSPSGTDLSGGDRYLQVCFDSNATGSDAVTGCGTTATSTGDTAFDKRFLPRKLITSNPYSLISKFLGTNYIYGGDGTESGVLTFLGNTGTAVSPSGAGTIYFDSGSNTFKCSQNGGAYVDCINTAAGGVTTIGTIDSQTKSTNGGVISGTTLYYQTADATNPGLVSTGTQTFAGAKTFSSSPTVSTFTQGSVIFAGTGGLLSQNNTNLFWDNSSGNLGVGTNTPTSFKIESGGNVGPNVAPTFSYSSTGTSSTLATGLHSSIAIKSNGYPIVTYLNSTDKNLYAYNCSNAVCSAGAATTLTNLGTSVGPKTAVAIRNDGTPIIAYQHGTNQDLMVYDCTSSDCTTGTTHTLDSTGNVGSYAAIAIRSSGLPIISYIDTTNHTIKVFDCSDTACSAGTARTIDTITSIGNGTSIAIRSGDLPIVAYYDDTTNDLNVYDCANSACSSGTVRTLDSTNDVGISPVIKIRSDGTPFIAYYYLTGNDVKGYSCANSACSSGTAVTVDSGTNGGYVSMVIGNNGYPIIGYETTAPVLKIYYCSNAACSSGTSLTLDSTSGPGLYQSMALGNDGNPVISHTTNTGGSLKVFATTSPSFSGGYNLGSSTKYWNNIYTGTLQLSAAGSTLVGLQASSSSSAWTLTLPSSTGTSGQVLTTNGSGITSWSSLPSGGVTTIGTIDSQTKSADGAVISGSSLYLQTADATNSGLVSTGTQTFAGAKTFSGALTASSTLGVSGLASLNAGTTITGGAVNFTGSGTNALNLNPYGASAGNTTEQRFLELTANGTEYVGFKAPDSIGTSQIYTLPSSSSNGVLKNSSGVLTWDTTSYLTSAITSINGQTGPSVTFATGTSGTDFNLAVTTNTLTFNLPDASASNRGVVTTGTQTFAGAKTFSSAPTVSTFTQGSVVFAGTSGLLSQNNAELFWNNTNGRLGLGTNSPSTTLHLIGDITVEEDTYGGLGTIGTESFGIGSGYLKFTSGGTNGRIATFNDGFNYVFDVGDSLGNASNFNYDLDVNGALSANGTLKILETGGSPTFYTTFQGGNQSADITYTLPATSANGVLTNTAGTLSWTTPTTGTVTGTGTSGQVTFWNGTSSITGDTSFNWDNSNKRLTFGTSNPYSSSIYQLAGKNVVSSGTGTIYGNAFDTEITGNSLSGSSYGYLNEIYITGATNNQSKLYGGQIFSGNYSTTNVSIISGLNVQSVSSSGSTSSLVTGITAGAYTFSGTTNTDVIALDAYVDASGTDTNVIGVNITGGSSSAANAYGIYLPSTFGGSSNNVYGLYIGDQSNNGSNSSSAYNIYSAGTASTNYFAGSLLFGGPTSAPSLSGSNQGKLYYDNTNDKFKCSENGSAYFNCFSSTATSGSGTANQVSYWNGTNSLTGDSGLIYDGTNLGVGGTPGSYRLDVAGTARFANAIYADGNGILNIRNAADPYLVYADGTAASYTAFGQIRGTYSGGDGRIKITSGNGSSEYVSFLTSGTNTGNVGITQPSPLATLHVSGTGQTTSALSSASGTNFGGTVLIQTTDGTVGSGGALVLGAGLDTFAALKASYQDGTANGVGYLYISTRNATSDTTLSERMGFLGNGLIRFYRPGVLTQYIETYGDSTGNFLTGVSASGAAKNYVILADTNSGSQELGTVAAQNVNIRTNNTTRFTVGSGGAIVMGQGVTSGTTTLDIGGTGTTFAVCHSTAAATTNDVNLVDCTGTPAADYMEFYSVNTSAIKGDIVYSTTNFVTTKDGETVSRLDRATSSESTKLVGIVSDITKAGDFNSIGRNIQDYDNPQPIALAGRVPVNIDLASDPIQPGDYVTVSTNPGKGKKLNGSGYVIGKALENWNPGQVSVMVIVENFYFSQNTSSYFSLDSSNNLVVNNNLIINGNIKANSLTIGANKLSIDTNGNLITAGNIQSANLTVTAQLNATNAVIQNLRIDRLAVNQTPSTGDATIGSGKILAGQTTITISNANITANSKVFLTSKTTSSQPFAVKNISPGISFDVVIPANAATDIDFDYWIVLE